MLLASSCMFDDSLWSNSAYGQQSLTVFPASAMSDGRNSIGIAANGTIWSENVGADNHYVVYCNTGCAHDHDT